MRLAERKRKAEELDDVSPAPEHEGSASRDARKKAKLEAGREFRADLLMRYKERGLTAEALCKISYRATRAGAVGVEDLALDPALRGQNYGRHITKALGLKADWLYWTKVPMWDKKAS